jgi:hypothetical protein
MRLWGPFSPIHLLWIFTLIAPPVAVSRAHGHDVRNFGRTLVIAGLLTFLPGSIMPAIAFGPLVGAGDAFAPSVDAARRHLVISSARLSTVLGPRLLPW